MDIEGKFGNASVDVAVNENGNLLVGQVSAKYQQLVLQGNVFGVTHQTAETTQAGLSATTPVLTLYNPLGSGVYGSILYAGATNLVAFAAASTIWLGANTNVAAAAVTGTLTTAHRNLLLGSATANKIQALLDATLPTAPVAISVLGAALTGAITTVPGTNNWERYYDGSIIMAPGTAISFQTSTASGAGFFGEFIWQELPQ